MLDDDNANEVGDGGTSDAEGEGYECVVSFKDGMKEVELELFFCDANEIESGVEVDDNDAIVCEMKNDISHSRLYGAHQVGQHPVLQMIGIQPSIEIKESHYLKMWIILEVGAPILSDQCLNQEEENTTVMQCRLALFLYLLML
jgi:hypothetical protein